MSSIRKKDANYEIFRPTKISRTNFQQKEAGFTEKNISLFHLGRSKYVKITQDVLFLQHWGSNKMSISWFKFFNFSNSFGRCFFLTFRSAWIFWGCHDREPVSKPQRCRSCCRLTWKLRELPAMQKLLITAFDVILELQTTSFLWLFQLDDSKSLHKKWLFHQTSIKKWLFRVPG